MINFGSDNSLDITPEQFRGNIYSYQNKDEETHFIVCMDIRVISDNRSITDLIDNILQINIIGYTTEEPDENYPYIETFSIKIGDEIRKFYIYIDDENNIHHEEFCIYNPSIDEVSSLIPSITRLDYKNTLELDQILFSLSYRKYYDNLVLNYKSDLNISYPIWGGIYDIVNPAEAEATGENKINRCILFTHNKPNHSLQFIVANPSTGQVTYEDSADDYLWYKYMPKVLVGILTPKKMREFQEKCCDMSIQVQDLLFLTSDDMLDCNLRHIISTTKVIDNIIWVIKNIEDIETLDKIVKASQSNPNIQVNWKDENNKSLGLSINIPTPKFSDEDVDDTIRKINESIIKDHLFMM